MKEEEIVTYCPSVSRIFSASALLTVTTICGGECADPVSLCLSYMPKSVFYSLRDPRHHPLRTVQHPAAAEREKEGGKTIERRREEGREGGRDVY